MAPRMVIAGRKRGLRRIIPVCHVLQRISLRTVTMPIPSQGIVIRDNAGPQLKVKDTP